MVVEVKLKMYYRGTERSEIDLSENPAGGPPEGGINRKGRKVAQRKINLLLVIGGRGD